ncbi:MAG TPA: sialidase family protein [Candidatus Sulfotelmatobacter sp.]|nr:sialidase family protein [Candidatus Sulfotelmatobacter sp.]
MHDVWRPDGELIVAFRRAPERRIFGETSTSHTDPNSYLMLLRSRDEGKTWSQTPELIYAHPFGGSQDPCLLQLKDGSLLCASYAWALLQAEAAAKPKATFRLGNFIFLSGCLLRCQDGARTWQGPILPPPSPGESVLDPFGSRFWLITAALCARARVAGFTGPWPPPVPVPGTKPKFIC